MLLTISVEDCKIDSKLEVISHVLVGIIEGGCQVSEGEVKDKKTEELVRTYVNGMLKNTYRGIAQLDEESADKVLQGTCKGCAERVLSFIVHNYGYDPENPNLDDWMVVQKKMDEFFFPGQSSLTRDGNIINDVVKVGECVCPLVKDLKLVEPSANLCLCGKNTMRTLYEWATQRPVKVELIEGCNRGGKCCHFRAELL